MRALIRFGLVSLFALSCSMPVVMAWGDTGHQLTARIAARRLTEAARRGIVALVRGADDDIGLKSVLGKTGDPQPSQAKMSAAMARMATWPDCMGTTPEGNCKAKGVTGPWHFVDVGLFEGPGHLAERCGEGSCITEMIPRLISNLRSGTNLVVMTESGTTRTFKPDRQLRFLIHFLGDLHQPLHSVTNADAGGNCVATTGFPGFKPQLHATWDSALVAGATSGTQGSVVTAILNEFQSEEATVSSVTDAAQIANESFALAKSELYGKTIPLVPTIDHFVHVSTSKCSTQAPPEIATITVDGKASFENTQTHKLVREQLFKGGVRLAAILNDVFSGDHDDATP